MLRIRLVAKTPTGARHLVHEGTMPPFLDGKEPKVIVWGSRTFALVSKSADATSPATDDGLPIDFEYEEVFAYWMAVEG